MAGSEKDPLIVVQSAEPTGLDPIVDRSVPSYSLTINIFDSLLEKTQDGRNVPALAESYDQESDTSWLFHLRKGVKFHNGEDFNATAVKYSIEKILDPASKSTRARDLNWIDKVEIVDNYTIRITAKRPFPLAAHYFTELQIVPPVYREKVGAQQFKLKPIGTGAYQLVSWDMGNRITLKRNDNYWKTPASIQYVEFQFVSSSTSRVATLLGGRADLITDPPVTAQKQIEKNRKTNFVTATGTRVIFVGLDTLQDSPLKDVRVRQALNYAIDKDAIIKRLLGNSAAITSTLLTDKDFGFDPAVKPYPYNPEKAKELLAQAGYKDGFSITIDTASGRYINDSAVVQAITGYLSKVGVNVNINTMEFGAYNSSLFGHKTAPMYFVGWGNPVFDASYVFNFITMSGSLLRTIENPAIDKLLKDANETVDQAKRKNLYSQADKLINEAAPAIFLYKQPVIYGMSTRLNWSPRSDEFLYMYDARFIND
ncbi:MAG: ABC transporter substrate-binding protein [Spirochaetales bacterium]|nr:ABC transporter substrate-binding protein [Spirochaetales bacterium]